MTSHSKMSTLSAVRLALTVCHELAHLLEAGGNHGLEWRATQDRLVQAVLYSCAGSFNGDGSVRA